jgi:PD-(D/E)XK nuclease superfamily
MTRMGKMIHEQQSGAIIGIAMEVLNELNPGLDEVLYERALVIELRRRGHEVAVQKSFPIFYRAELIGNLIPDLIVDSSVIVDSPDSNSRFFLISKTLAWIGGVSCGDGRLTRKMSPIFKPDSCPCHPRNPRSIKCLI